MAGAYRSTPACAPRHGVAATHGPGGALADVASAALPPEFLGKLRLVPAVAVQDALVERSQHRGAKIADLLIAAAAEAAGLVVLHYDHDFDLIAEITGQPMEWIVPAGAVP